MHQTSAYGQLLFKQTRDHCDRGRVLRQRRLASSALSRLNFRVEPLQFHSGFVDGELPIDSSLLLVDTGGPGGNFGLQRLDVADPSVLQALAGHATQLTLRHVEPTAVLGSVNEIDPPHVVAGLVGRERFVPGRPESCLPGLPQIRTCPIKAYGSSDHACAAARHTEWTANAGGSGNRFKSRVKWSQEITGARARRDSHFRQSPVTASRNRRNPSLLPVIP